MRIIIFVLSSTLLFGCIGNPIKNKRNDTVSLVAAMVNMDTLNARCNTGRLRNLDNDSESEVLWYMYRANTKNQCILYSMNVEPGRYTIEQFDSFAMQGASSSTATSFKLPNKGKPYGIHNIKKQGIYYLGAYKFVRSKTGAVNIVKTKNPREKQILSEMLNHRLMNDGDWKELIKRKIKHLK